MHPVSMMIILSIGNVVGWLAAMYVKDALPGLMGHIVISTIGAYIAGYWSLRIFPEFDILGMIISAFLGAAFLLFAVRFRKWRS
jgi:uncharacterized membrane protein YeaQ/YmgE (transglycosylase-associated protein family)